LSRWPNVLADGPLLARVGADTAGCDVMPEQRMANKSRTSSDLQERMSRLAESFPSLRGCLGVRPWDPEALDGWAASGVATESGRYAAQFVLSIWFAEHSMAKAGPFNLSEALGTWDPPHRAAFAAWAAAPWWP
jgi:hypothetical protein